MEAAPGRCGMAPRDKAVREPVVTELLAEEIAHLLMRADGVEPRTVHDLVEHLRGERSRHSQEDRS